MIYCLVDRKLVKAESWKILVGILRILSFDVVHSKKEYMENVAERVQELEHKYIEHYNYRGFCVALERMGLIQVLRCVNCDSYCYNAEKDIYYCSKNKYKISDIEGRKWDCGDMHNKYIKKKVAFSKSDNDIFIKGNKRLQTQFKFRSFKNGCTDKSNP